MRRSSSSPSHLRETLDLLVEEAAGGEGPAVAPEILSLGRKAIEEGDLPLAERCVEELLGIDPDGEEVLTLAQAIDEHRRGGEAIPLPAQGREEAPEPVAAVVPSAPTFRERSPAERYADSAAAFEADPGNPSLRADLGALAEQLGLRDDLAQRYEALLPKVSHAAVRSELRAELGAMLLRTPQGLDEAVRTFREVLQEHPRHPATLASLHRLVEEGEGRGRVEAARILAPIFREERDFPRHVGMLEILAEAEEDPGARCGHFLEIVAIHSDSLPHPEKAFLAAGRALRADPDREEALLAAEGAAAAASMEETLVALLEEAAPLATSPDGKLRLYVALARRCEAYGRDGQALDAWLAARAVQPGDREILEAVVRLRSRGGDGVSYLDALRSLVAILETDAERRPLLREIARVQREWIGDPAAAWVTLGRLQELAPDDDEVLREREALAEELQRWGDLAQVLEERIRLAEPSAPTELLVRLAALRETRLLQREGALDLYERVLGEEPAQGEAILRLWEMLTADPRNQEIIRILEIAHRAAGDDARLARLLEHRIGFTLDSHSRRGLLLELAALHRRQGRSDLAFLAMGRAFREDPGAEALWAELTEVSRAADCLDEWLALAEEEMDRASVPAAAASLARHLARTLEAEGDPGAASLFWEKALARDPGASDAFAALDRFYLSTERWGDLARVLRDRASRAGDPGERGGLLARLATLQEERLDDEEGAARSWQALLQDDPADPVALRSLEAIYEKKGNAEALYRNLLAQRELAEGAARAGLTLRLGELAQERLQDPERAIVHLREALADGKDDPLLRDRLADLYEEQGRVGDLLDLLREGAQKARDGREAVRLLLRLALRLRAQGGDPEEVLRTYREVLAKDPRNRQALEALRGLHGERREHGPLEEILRRMLPLQDDPARIKEIRLELVEALHSQDKKAEAVEAARRFLELEPHRREDLSRIERLLRQLPGERELIRTLELSASLEENPEGRAVLLQETAALWTRIGRPEMAAQALERLLELRPRDLEAFTALRALYRRGADWRRYVVATESRISLLDDGKEKVELLLDLAEVQDERLGQRELAFARLSAALGIAPADAALLSRLQGLAEKGGMHEELSLVLESVAEEAGPDAAPLWLLRGRIQDAFLDDPGEAEASFRRILDGDPFDREALDALRRLFESRGDWVGLVEILERQADVAPTDEDRRALHLSIGRLRWEKLGQADAALADLQRAFEADPGDPEAAKALLGALESSGRYGEVVGILSRLRDLAGASEEAIERELEIARVCELHLGDDEQAVSSLTRVLSLAPDHAEALEALERLYTAADRASDLLRVYDRKLELAGEDEERSRLLLKAASIWEEKLGNPGHAVACLEGAISLEPDNLPALRDLERLLRSQGEWKKLAEVYLHHESILRGGADDGEKLELWTRLGEVYLDQLQQMDRAEQAWRTALSLDPQARRPLAGLGAIYEKTGNWPDALALLQQQAAWVPPGPEAVELHHRMGRIHREMLLDFGAARDAFEAARALDPGHLPSIRALKEMHRERGEAQESFRLLLEEAAYTLEPEAKGARFFEAGSFELARGEREGAIRYFEEAIRCDPSHLDAARALADLLVETEAWEEAEAALVRLCSRLSPAADAEELVRRSVRLGAVRERIEDRPGATEGYARAYELDPTHLPAAEGLARMRLAAGDRVQALKIYQGILIHHREELSEAEVVEIHHTIGDLRGRLGDRAAGLKSLRNALELDPWHRPSLRASVQLAEEEGDFEAALEYRRKLLEVEEGEAALELLRSTARLSRERLEDPHGAIDCLVALLRRSPADTEAMEDLLELYVETRQASKAISLLERMLATPTAKEDPRRAATYHRRLGEIHREEGRSAADWLQRAALHFESALNLDWKQSTAFSALEKMLVGAREWRLLEEAYLRMIERLSGKVGYEAARTSLFRNLADLYYEVLSRQEEAAKAYKAVVALDPSDIVARERYAELVAKEAGSEEEAVAAYRKLLAVPESRVAASKALVRLHAKRKSLDDAFVSAQVVSHLMGEGGRDEEGILARLKPFAKDSSTSSLLEDDWKDHLLHEDAKGHVASIFGLVHREAGSVLTADLDALQVQGKRVRVDPGKDVIDPAESMLFLASAVRYVAATMGMEPPVLFRAEEVVGLTVVETFPLSILVGPDMLSDRRTKKELFFLLARNLAFTRPELAFAALRRRDELQLLLEAALALGEPRFSPTSDLREVEALRRRLDEAMSPEAKDRLRALAGESVGRRLSLRRYVEAAEMTATRVGALLCGDLQIAARCLAADGGAGGRLEVGLLLDGLASYCLSESYAELRRKIGLAVSLPA